MEKTDKMNAERYLLDNNIHNVVLNIKEYPENTPENAEKWIYVSDVMNAFAASKLEEVREKLTNQGYKNDKTEYIFDEKLKELK